MSVLISKSRKADTLKVVKNQLKLLDKKSKIETRVPWWPCSAHPRQLNKNAVYDGQL